MLIQFRFKNFKSFRDDTILDFSATKITEFSDRLSQIGNERILPVAAIFGANASGKTNVINAFRFMSSYVLQSFAYGEDVDENNTKAVFKKPKYTPFLFDNLSKEAESLFEVYFIDTDDNRNRMYNYGFTLNQTGVLEEWLNSKAKTAIEYKPIFYRNNKELNLSGLPSKNSENIRVSLKNKSLIVSLGAILKISKLKKIRDWFYNNDIMNFGDPIESIARSAYVPKGFSSDKSIQNQVVAYLSSFDPSIIGFSVKVLDEDEDKQLLKIDSIHRVIGTKRTVVLPFEEESAGTQKMFALYPSLQNVLNKGGVLLVDELNARLHPLLVRSFLITFLNPKINTKHAQLIFTTHDAWQLSNQLLRRDEIWFTEKGADGVSTLYSLADFVDEEGIKIRKDESYEKNYLLGKYGAIPTLSYFKIPKEDQV